MLEYQDLKAAFAANANTKLASGMKKYMRNQFDFYGYRTKVRKALYHEELLQAKKEKQIDWGLLNQAWNNQYRGLQYFVCDYLIAMKKFLTYDDLPRIEKFVRPKQWWV